MYDIDVVKDFVRENYPIGVKRRRDKKLTKQWTINSGTSFFLVPKCKPSFMVVKI